MSKTKKWFHIHTLRRRLTLILGISVLLCFLLVVVVSFISIQAIESSRIENAMRADLARISEKVDQDYYALVQMSQQMTSSGNVGKAVDNYLTSEAPYERIEASNVATTNINIMVFSHSNISLVSYFQLTADKKIDKAIFATHPMGEETDPREMVSLMETNELALQSIHSSLNLFSGRDVVSLIRRVRFSTDEDCFIYAELFTDAGNDLRELSESRDVPYFLLQVDSGGVVRYSSDETFSVSESPGFQLTNYGEIESYQDYMYLTNESRFGFYNVLLLPRSAYNQQTTQWFLQIGSVFLATLTLIVLTGFLLFRLIIQPIQALGKDMSEAGEGNLVPVSRSFKVDEFDELFGQFEEMKGKIVGLMEDVRCQESEKKQLEIDKLYYQINPHFLMNALNSVHWMAVVNKQPDIDRFVYQLNYILGYSLGKTVSEATLRTELKSLELYLALQQERYDFKVWMDVEEGDYLDYPSARLILQPLAENAVCHNMSDFGNLWVSVRNVNEDYAEIVMRDDGKGFHTARSDEPIRAKQQNKGIGLRYVQMSLESFYESEAKLEIESTPQIGTTVKLFLPLQKGDR